MTGILILWTTQLIKLAFRFEINTSVARSSSVTQTSVKQATAAKIGKSDQVNKAITDYNVTDRCSINSNAKQNRRINRKQARR